MEFYTLHVGMILGAYICLVAQACMVAFLMWFGKDKPFLPVIRGRRKFDLTMFQRR